MRSTIFGLLIGLIFSAPALAWNKPSHMVIGAIAYDVLEQENPKALARALDLLRQHPQYADVFAKRLESVAATNRDRYLFMIAARWADDVRDNATYHRGNWHYINDPVVAKTDEGKIAPKAPVGENVLTAIKENTATAANNKLPPDKAVALTWLFHLVGDVHQPLHATSYYSTDQWPRGDLGGNAFNIRAKAGGAVINLHSLWDGLVLGTQTYQAVSNTAIELRKRPEFAREKLKELQAIEPAQWAKESYQIAVEVAYQNRTLNGSNDRAEGPVLPDGYTDAAKTVAERRMMLAGYRLSDLLSKTLK